MKFGINNTWIQNQDIENKGLYEKYAYSLYWSISTMVTILLFIPDTNYEIIFMIFAVIITCGMFGILLNTFIIKNYNIIFYLNI